MGTFEEDYEDVLQNLEFGLVQAYRQIDDMTDHDAQEGVNGLIRIYTAEQRGRPAPRLKLSPAAQAALDNVRAFADWRLGRKTLETSDGEPFGLRPKPLAVSEMIACLKRIRRSIEMWQKELGRRGYYDFVSQFFAGPD